jgi:hypothetical protein
MEKELKPSKLYEELGEEEQNIIDDILLDGLDYNGTYYKIYCNWDNEIWIESRYSKFMVI